MGGFIATLTDPEELYLIVNPHAGGGRAARVWRQLQQTYKWLGTAAPVAFTTGLNPMPPSSPATPSTKVTAKSPYWAATER